MNKELNWYAASIPFAVTEYKLEKLSEYGVKYWYPDSITRVRTKPKLENITPGYIYIRCSTPKDIEKIVAKVFTGARFVRDVDDNISPVTEWVESLRKDIGEERRRFELGDMIVIGEGIFRGEKGIVVNFDTTFYYILMFYKDTTIRIPIHI